MLLSLLATVTGTFDAISYLGLRRVFVANMTGNTVLLGLHAGQGDWFDALRVAAALVGFTLGVAAGGTLIMRERLRLSTALVAEAIMLALAGVIWVTAGTAPERGPLYALILLSSVAMGVQSAAIRSLEVPGVLTTAITNTMAAATLGLLPGLVPNNAETHPVKLQGAVVATYVIGAGIGGAARFAWGTNAVVPPSSPSSSPSGGPRSTDWNGHGLREPSIHIIGTEPVCVTVSGRLQEKAGSMSGWQATRAAGWDGRASEAPEWIPGPNRQNLFEVGAHGRVERAHHMHALAAWSMERSWGCRGGPAWPPCPMNDRSSLPPRHPVMLHAVKHRSPSRAPRTRPPRREMVRLRSP